MNNLSTQLCMYIECDNQIWLNNFLNCIYFNTFRPVLIPEKNSRLSVHPDRCCMSNCSSCHEKFDLHDIPNHIAQIKDPGIQKTFLESM